MLEGRDTVIFKKVNRKALWKMQHVIKDLKERWEQVCGYLEKSIPGSGNSMYENAEAWQGQCQEMQRFPF